MAGKKANGITELVWPAVICSADHDELLYLASRKDWNAHVDEPGPGGSMHDVLVDSVGHRYTLGDVKGKLSVLAFDGSETLGSMIERLRRYARLNGQCCITKIVAQDVRQAVELVKSIDEQQA